MRYGMDCSSGCRGGGAERAATKFDNLGIAQSSMKTEAPFAKSGAKTMRNSLGKTRWEKRWPIPSPRGTWSLLVVEVW
jgi:hypothetical protein